MQINKSKKAQSAIESLMTYGWAIILVVAVIVVLFLLGVFSPLHFISPSPTVSGFTGVKVTTVVANYTYIEFYLTNDLSITVNLNKFLLAYNSTDFSDIHCQYLTLSSGQNSICFGKLNLANTRDTVSLGIDFAISNRINASSNGTMSFVPADITLPLPSIITQFSEEGLPSGLQWWVDYKGINHSSTGTQVSFATIPGNYSFIVGNASFNGCIFTALPSSGYVEAGLVKNIIFINSCAATFIEKELPTGTKWQVVYAGLDNTSNSNLMVFTNEKSGTYSFSVYNSVVGGCIYYPSPSSGSLSVGKYQYIRFLGECTTTFSETGLPPGYNWKVTYDGVQESNTTSVIYYFGAPGNYSYSVNTLSNSTSNPDCSTTYTPSPSTGTVAEGSTVSIIFSAQTTCTTTFTESNLPSGYNWKVTYDSITNNANAPSDITFVTKTSGSNIPTFSYSVNTLSNSSSTLDCTTTYTPSPSSGTAEAGTTNTISFSGSTSCITTFKETGLSSGTTWSVTYNGVDNSSTAPSDITFHTTTSGGSIPSYSYTINSVSPNSSSTLNCTTSYTPSPSSGTAEAGSLVAVSFSEKTNCTTTFDESNLPTSYPWNVTFNNVEKTSTSSSMQFTTINSGGSIPSYSYSVPTISAATVEWNFGTSSYQGGIHQGMPTLPFPLSLSDLNNNNVACSSPYDSQGYTAVGYMYFTSSITVTITSDDAMAVFYAPAGSSSWSSVFGSDAWQGEGATQYGPTTVSVTPGWYEVAVDWTNICGPGMSAFEINGAYMTSNQFNVIGWTPSSNSVKLLPYSDVTANPADPSGITVEQTGSWAHQFNGYFTYTYTPSPSSNTVSAGSTNSISYSTSGTASTEFYQTNLPSSPSSWSVTYDGSSGSNSDGSPITLSQGGQSSPSNYTATATADVTDGVTCTASASVLQGTTYTFTSWICQIPLSVNNLASSSTPSTFQEGVYLDTNTYSTFLNSTMQNVEFTYSNGTVIPSWYEGTYTNSVDGVNQPQALFWLKLTGIAGSSSENIYLNFAYPTSNNLFNGNTVGEAPQLSSTYAEYDDGANVFNDYWNFAGTSLPSGWVSSNQNFVVNNGLTISPASSASAGYIGYSTSTSVPFILDSYITKWSAYSGTSWGEVWWGAGTSFNNPFDAWYGGIQEPDSAQWDYDVSTGTSVDIGTPSPGVFSEFYTSSVSGFYTNYTNPVSTSVSSVGSSLVIGGQVQNSASGDTVIQWARVRSDVPNGISSPSFSNPGGISSGYSYSATNYLPGSLALGFSTYSNSSAPSCKGYELASSGTNLQLNGQCNWGGGYMDIYYAGGNAGYVGFYIYGASDGQTYADGSSDDSCLNTNGGSAEILNLYVPAQTINIHAGLGNGGGTCNNGGVIIN